MPYYQGDFYRGDFYQGDPFWGAAWGFAKAAIGAGRRKIASVLAGAPAAAGAASTAIMKMPGGAIVQRAGGAVVRVATKHPVLTAAGAAGTIGVLGGVGGARVMGPGAAPGMVMRGFHVIKKGPQAGALARNRRMRVTNPRALRRAIRRATGFARLARRVLHFTSPRAPRGRAIFKRRRKK